MFIDADILFDLLETYMKRAEDEDVEDWIGKLDGCVEEVCRRIVGVKFVPQQHVERSGLDWDDIRKKLDDEDFLRVETPTLTRSVQLCDEIQADDVTPAMWAATVREAEARNLEVARTHTGIYITERK